MTEEAKAIVEKRRKLTRAQKDFLQLALRSPGGNPWPLIGIRQRGGGAKDRMFREMQAEGLFDDANCITELGRNTLLSGESQ